MATNQGESSTQDNEVKKPFMMPTPDNIAGNESGVSDTAGLGTTSGQLDTAVEYSVKDVNTPNSSRLDYMKTDNDDYDHTNRSAKFKYPNVSEDQGAGAGQYM